MAVKLAIEVQKSIILEAGEGMGWGEVQGGGGKYHDIREAGEVS